MNYLRKRFKFFALGGTSLFLILTVLGVVALAAGTAIVLDFNSLPSTQGWVYDDDSTGVSETAVFSVNGTDLHQDTVNTSAGEFNAWYYRYSGVVDPTLPFALSVRARITAEEHPSPTNICGFCFLVDTGTELFGFGLSAAPRVADIFEVTVSTIDTTQYHDYRLEATPGVGWDFYIDGALIASGPPRTAGAGLNSLSFGDLTRGPNAIGDIAGYSFVHDTDKDGVFDDADPFPNSNVDPTVVIDGCDSEVGNQALGDGSTFNDLIGQAAENANNHGEFVSAVTQLANQWKADGLISGKEKGKITSCAAQADIP